MIEQVDALKAQAMGSKLTVGRYPPESPLERRYKMPELRTVTRYWENSKEHHANAGLCTTDEQPQGAKSKHQQASDKYSEYSCSAGRIAPFVEAVIKGIHQCLPLKLHTSQERLLTFL